MTLTEFIAPILGDRKSTERILAVLYYKNKQENIPSMTVDQIRAALKTARVSGASQMNISDILGKAGARVHIAGNNGNKRLWAITKIGQIFIQELLSLSGEEAEIENDVRTLQKIVGGIADVEIREYIEEGLRCFAVGAIRACIVFVWTGAVRTLQYKMVTHGFQEVTQAIQKHDSKARAMSSIDDFAYVKDSIALLAAKELGLLDKNQKETLVEALNLRNRCGHPSKYSPGLKKASSFIEDVVAIVFS